MTALSKKASPMLSHGASSHLDLTWTTLNAAGDLRGAARTRSSASNTTNSRDRSKSVTNKLYHTVTMSAGTHRHGVVLVRRILYQTLYYVLCLLLAVLMCVTPADLIRQTYNRNLWGNIIGILVICGGTALTLLFIYSYRLYANRTSLENIPRYHVPVTKLDGMPKRVRHMINEGLAQSAAVALENIPKAISPQVSADSVLGQEGVGMGLGLDTVREEKPLAEKQDGTRVYSGTATGGDHIVSIREKKVTPHWGEIKHPGWGSPDSPDLANVEYDAVIKELGPLLEARAVSLAPPVMSEEDASVINDPHQLDANAVSLLSRHPSMGMRRYLYHLVDLGVVPRSPVVATFIDKYERARFSGRPVYEQEFKELMDLSAEVMGGMQAPDLTLLGSDDGSLKSRWTGKSSVSFIMRD